MDLVQTPTFTESMATSITDNGVLDVTADDLAYTSLGYLVLFDEDQAPVEATSEGRGSDFHEFFGGADQYWPWWCWLLFGVGLLCCLPVACCIYKNAPGQSGPPSPSGAGGGPGMFGSKGGVGVAEAEKAGEGGDPWDADLTLKENEKGGFVETVEEATTSASAFLLLCFFFVALVSRTE